jgi:type IV conjugative transfer system protein TraL
MAGNFETRIPRYLNSQAQLLWWELDEVIVITAALGIGIMYEILILAIPIALAAAKAMAKMKAERGHGWILHAAWWHGIPIARLTIPAVYREFWG